MVHDGDPVDGSYPEEVGKTEEEIVEVEDPVTYKSRYCVLWS